MPSGPDRSINDEKLIEAIAGAIREAEVAAVTKERSAWAALCKAAGEAAYYSRVDSQSAIPATKGPLVAIFFETDDESTAFLKALPGISI